MVFAMFSQFIFPRSQKIINFQTKASSIERKCPYRHKRLGLGLGFLDLEWDNNLVGQEYPSCPGRMYASHEHETSIIYVTHVPTSHCRWLAPHQAITRSSPKAKPVRRGHANARPPIAGTIMRRSLGRVQMRHR